MAANRQSRAAFGELCPGLPRVVRAASARALRTHDAPSHQVTLLSTQPELYICWKTMFNKLRMSYKSGTRLPLWLARVYVCVTNP